MGRQKRVPGAEVMALNPADVERVVGGDVTGVHAIRTASQDDLRSAWERSSKPVLSAAAVRRVLHDLMTGEADPELVQMWGSFIMRGHLQSIGPLRPIDVEYEPRYEDQIIEAIAVLEQIGDLIDGDPSEAQLRQLIADLSESDQ